MHLQLTSTSIATTSNVTGEELLRVFSFVGCIGVKNRLVVSCNTLWSFGVCLNLSTLELESEPVTICFTPI
jgi:hypothetical protein